MLKSPFINMRGQVLGTWEVLDYVNREGQGNWDNHYWLCRCTVCGSDPVVLERREIRRPRPKKCPTCLAADRARSEERRRHARELAALAPRKTGPRPGARTLDWDRVGQLYLEGKSPRQIAKHLGCAQSTITHVLQKLGLKAPRMNRETYRKVNGLVAYPSREAAAEARRNRYAATTGKERAARRAERKLRSHIEKPTRLCWYGSRSTARAQGLPFWETFQDMVEEIGLKPEGAVLVRRDRKRGWPGNAYWGTKGDVKSGPKGPWKEKA